jgi:hypothetical protein
MNSQSYPHSTEAPLHTSAAAMNPRSEVLAARLEAGATAWAAFAATFSEADWQTRLHKDGRKIGVLVNHVASPGFLSFVVLMTFLLLS